MIPSPVPAQALADPDPLAWVVEAALSNNLGLEQERLMERRAEADLREARGRYLPSVSIQGRYTEQSGTLDLGDFVNPAYAALNRIEGVARFPTDLALTLPLKHESAVHLTQPVFNARIKAGHAAARYRLAARRTLTRAAERDLAARAQVALLDVAAARALRRIWEETIPLVEEGLRVSERLVSAGSATPDAVTRAQSERAEVIQALADAREQEAAATRALNQMIGRPLDVEVPLPDDSAFGRTLQMTESEAVARALSGREELRALDADIAAAGAGVRAATASFLPEAAVAVSYGFQGSSVVFDREHDYWTASLVLSWNVFNGGRDLARREGARIDASRLRVARAEAEEFVTLEVRQAWSAARVAAEAIHTAEARATSARRTFELVRRRWEEGMATQVEFLDARTNLTRAELNRAFSLYRYQVRRVGLERATAEREIPTLQESPR